MLLAHKPLNDPNIQLAVFESLKKQTPESISLDVWTIEDYLNSFTRWIEQSNHNTVIGLNKFQNRAYCVGAMDAIQSFVYRHALNRRMRFARAEFVGAKIACNSIGSQWCYFEDAPLTHNDAVIISLPFAGNGNNLPDYQSIIDHCVLLDIPVLLDLSYYGISRDFKFDLTPSCIKEVVFSLSKCFSTTLRLGMRLTVDCYDDIIQHMSNDRTLNRVAINVGIDLLNTFSHNWLMSRYQPLQDKVCTKLNISPSPTVTLAIGNKNQHQDFYRQGYYRICITDELHKELY